MVGFFYRRYSVSETGLCIAYRAYCCDVIEDFISKGEENILVNPLTFFEINKLNVANIAPC